MQSVARPKLWALLVALALACGLAAQDGARAADAGSGYVDDIRPPGAPAPAAAPGVAAGEAAPSAGAALWRRIREGEAGRVLFLDAGSAVLIQAESETWRRVVTGTVQSLGAWLLFATGVVMATLYAVRGRTAVSRHGALQRRIQRFSRVQRVAHWLTALSFLVLAATGLNLVYGRSVLLPLLGADPFAAVSRIGEALHHVTGFAFALGILLLALVWLPGSRVDREVRQKLRAAGQPATGKYSWLHKASWAFFVLVGALLAATGAALLFPALREAAGLTRLVELQRVHLAHSALGFLSMAAVVAHVYLGAVARQGSLTGVLTGYVSEAWARQHHPGWLETVLRRAPALTWPVATQRARASGGGATAGPAAEGAAGAPERGGGADGRDPRPQG